MSAKSLIWSDRVKFCTLLAQRIQSLTVGEIAALHRALAESDSIGIDETAALLMVHPVTLRKKAVAWGVPHKRLGTEWRFSRQRLSEWLQQST